MRAARCATQPSPNPLPEGEGTGYRLAEDRVHTRHPRDRTPAALMLQGTSSNAGKSVLTAAICRILLQDGVRVAPFKAQNMSLNSFVTRDGGEMGRAQVVQAQACRVEPDVRMNPILLKPNSDTGSQVIVRGKPVGNMRVGEYVGFKPQAFAAACECYDSLAEQFDAIVLEGAGSPAEVNLKHHDITNMRMARHAGAAVLVVGDIDRGGVFASFVGTLEVLAPWERRMVAGWIVNRFRGDAGLLAPALEYTQSATGRPVLGVVPYLPDLGLPQEDSVEFKSGLLDAPGGNGEAVEIAVVDLPHIANFTDFDAFRGESDVRLRIVRQASDLGQPDAVVIPGSKNTLADLDCLRRNGLAERIEQLARGGRTEVVGVCGGFQMLGREIRDPLALESANGLREGLGLLDAVTVLAAEKTLVRAAATHVPSGLEVAGYEIHHGRTDANGSPRAAASPRTAGRSGRQRRRPRLGHVPPRRFRRRPLPPLVHRPPADPPRAGAAGPSDRAVRHRAGAGPAGRRRPPQPRHGGDLSPDETPMTIEQQILAAVALDLVLGDPRWLPHPVRGIAALAARLESLSPRRRAVGRRACGGDGVCRRRRGGLGSGPAGRVGLVRGGRRRFHRRYLHEPCRAGPGAAQHGRLPAAGGRRPGRGPPPRGLHRRTRHGGVGRSGRRPRGRGKRRREHRRRRGRAAVLRPRRRAGRGDGLSGDQHVGFDVRPSRRALRPLRLGGRPLRRPGQLPPRAADGAALCLAAAILRQRPLQAVRVLLRDGRKHASPNAGLPEAAMAGALGVQLGGPVSYDGVPMDRPTLGDPLLPLAPRHILLANALMWTSAAMFLAAGLSLRLGAAHLWHLWRAAA